jgi:hypothetical protein
MMIRPRQPRPRTIFEQLVLAAAANRAAMSKVVGKKKLPAGGRIGRFALFISRQPVTPPQQFNP